jgi:isovaleryl-CoA dehydrogenase
MKAMGMYGLLIPSPYGDLGVSAACFALVSEELARGWMSLSGAIGGHSVVANLILRFGTKEQQLEYLPRMAQGELLAAMALTEAGGGSDLQAMRTKAVLKDGHYVVNGSKTWITHAEHAGLIAVMVKTSPNAEPPSSGISILLAEKGAGLAVSQPFGKLGYRGIESCEVTFDEHVVPVQALLGEVEGQGFTQMMAGLEIGRIQVAARSVGVARAALDASLRYAQEREAFGKPIWQHQSIGNYLADMAIKVEASRALVLQAATCFDAGGRCDLEVGMAKLFSSEAALQVTIDAMRIHGSYGYSTDLDIERYFRDAPLMIIGEGTNEIQRNIIAKQLIRRGSVDSKPPDGVTEQARKVSRDSPAPPTAEPMNPARPPHDHSHRVIGDA